MPRLGRRLFRLGLSGSFGLDEAGCREALERVQYVFWSPRMKALTPALLERRRPAAVAYTATAWRKLLRAPRGWAGKFPTAGECYRFCLADPHVDVVLTGPRSVTELRENLAAHE